MAPKGVRRRNNLLIAGLVVLAGAALGFFIIPGIGLILAVPALALLLGGLFRKPIAPA